jgi:hypothetical protein
MNPAKAEEVISEQHARSAGSRKEDDMKPTSILSTVVGAALAMSAMSANALTIRVTDGVTTVNCTDGAACDTNSTAGIVSFNTALGALWLDISSTGYGPNLIPGFSLDLKSGQLSTSGPATVQVLLSEVGFNKPSIGQSLAIGGTSDGTIQMKAYAGVNEFDMTTLLGDTGVLSGSPFSGSASGDAKLTGPFSLTIWTEIKHQGAGLTTYDANLKVPEPGTLALLGLGLLGIGAARRTRKSS